MYFVFSCPFIMHTNATRLLKVKYSHLLLGYEYGYLILKKMGKQLFYENLRWRLILLFCAVVAAEQAHTLLGGIQIFK